MYWRGGARVFSSRSQTTYPNYRQCWRSSCKYILSRTYSGVPSIFAPQKGDRVVVAMSGGVDSSVTAMILAQQDYDLSAVFMRNWDTRDESGTDKGCEWEKDWEDVQLVCRKLGIPCEMIDLSRAYWTRVFEPSLQHWELGMTPNPDVWCNREIKFGLLLEKLSLCEKTWVATGHYARKDWFFSTSETPARPRLLRAADQKKDQTFYLAAISEKALRRTLFPIGDLIKSQVRELAQKHNLPTAGRSESMGLCFVGEKTKFNRFLSSYISPNPGPIALQGSGEIIGQHSGLWEFTVGQNVRVPGMPKKMFLAYKDVKSNTMFVVAGSEHPSLYSSNIRLHSFTWIWNDAPPPQIDSQEGYRTLMMHRYRMQPVPCTVRRLQSDIVIQCDEAEKAVCPGQVASLFDRNWVLGCGVIG